jgi:hypothetical protein
LVGGGGGGKSNYLMPNFHQIMFFYFYKKMNVKYITTLYIYNMLWYCFQGCVINHLCECMINVV